MKLLNKKLKFASTIGDVLNLELIQKIIQDCKKFECDASLEHNGVKYTITRFTNADQLLNNWINQ